jgi:hypothetical protein
MTASLAIAERVAALVAELGVELGPQRALERVTPVPAAGPWWRRVAEYRGVA